MLPDSPSPRAALALSDLQPQTGASPFTVGTGSGNWSTHGVGGVGGDSYMEKNAGGLFANNRQQDRPGAFDGYFNQNNNNNASCSCSSGGLFGKK